MNLSRQLSQAAILYQERKPGRVVNISNKRLNALAIDVLALAQCPFALLLKAGYPPCTLGRNQSDSVFE
jgi:hypothetical protein